MVFSSAANYIESCTTIKAKIAAINAVQNALITNALKAVETGNMTQYSLNDGQTIIQTTYRNPAEIENAYTGFERIKQMLINQLTGRSFRLLDGKNFPGNGC